MTPYKYGRRANFLFVFLLLLFLSASLMFLHALFEKTHTIVLIKNTQYSHLQIGGKGIKEKINELSKDLRFFSRSPAAQQLVNQPNDAHACQGLSRALGVFAETHKNYKQLRYIDKQGMEIIRVKYQQDQATVVDRKDLLNISDRYYFSEAMALDKGQFYLSPMDLSMEHDEIEYPFKPVLRIGTPLFDKNGTKQGILLFNYLASVLLTDYQNALADAQVHLKSMQHVHGEAMILNQDGYWLLAPDKKDEWGFMLNSNRTLRKKFPDVWAHILKHKEGQIITTDGLFSFTTTCPHQLAEIQEKDSCNSDFFWILMSHIPADKWHSFIALQKHFHWILFSGMICLILPISWIISGLRHSNRQSKLKMIEQKNLLETIINTMPDIICLKDGQGRWLLANDYNLNLFQLEEVDYQGKTDAELAQSSEFYRDAFLECMDTDNKAWELMEPSRGEKTIPRPHGLDKIFDIVKIPMFYADGSRNTLLVTGRDITTLKHQQDKISHLVLIQKTMVKIHQLLATEKKVQPLLQKTCNILTGNRGYPSAWIVLFNEGKVPILIVSSCVQKNLENLEKDLHNGLYPACIKEVLLQRELLSVPEQETFCKKCPLSDGYLAKGIMAAPLKHGDSFYGVLTVALPRELLYEKEEKELFTEIAHDIGYGLFNIDLEEKRQKAEKTVRASEERLMQSEKMATIAGLAAGVAHEINTPLSAILQSIQIISQGLAPDTPRNRELAKQCDIDLDKVQNYFHSKELDFFLNGIKESAQKASAIISNLLQFSRPLQGEPLAVNLASLLDNAIDLIHADYDLKKQFRIHTISFVKEYDADFPAVTCVPMEIEQVLLNLMKNGVQALAEQPGSSTKPQIIIRLSQTDSMARIEIEDNGPGMTTEVRSHIFDPFFTTKEVGQGTGLGLSVSYTIICNKHGGNILVDSILGKGAKFIVELPIVKT